MESYIGKNGTFALMKNLNLEKVFRTVVLRAPISRAEISRVTGLNKVTVSNCVKSLFRGSGNIWRIKYDDIYCILHSKSHYPLL